MRFKWWYVAWFFAALATVMFTSSLVMVYVEWANWMSGLWIALAGFNLYQAIDCIRIAVRWRANEIGGSDGQ
jgi:hypothetical protein